MTRLTITIFLAILANMIAMAQLPTDFRTEQIFLTTDRRDYNPDDTIRVEGIVTALAGETALPYSRIVYVELIHNGSDSVVVRHKIASRPDGTFGDMILPEPDMVNGDYFLRAYTRFMLNFSRDALAFHHIKIGESFPANDGVIDDDVSCDVVASGGALLPDVAQQLTAVLTNHLGYPIDNADLALVTSTGDTLEVRRTSPSGYAVFNFVPRPEQSYRLRFSAMGVDKEFPAPPIDAQACKADMALKDRRLRFALSGNIPAQKRLFTFDRCNGLSEITTAGNTGSVNLAMAPEGPLTLFLTDENLNIIAQKSVMPSVKPTMELSAPDSIKPGEIIDFNISGLATDSATVMARVIPDDGFAVATSVTALQLSNDFDSPLPLPTLSDSPSAYDADLNTWLSAAAFKRFDLADAVRSDSTIYRIMPEHYITLNGIVYDDENAKHPMKGGQIVAYNNADRSISDATVDSDGRFSIAVSDFTQGTEFFLQATNSKGVMIKGVIKLDDATYPAVGILPQIDNRHQHYIKGDVTVGETGPDKRTLPDVTVKANYEIRRKKNDKKYYGVRYKDREYFEKRPDYTTLIDVLRDMQFLRVTKVAASNEEDYIPSDNAFMSSAKHPVTTYYVIRPTRLASTLDGSAEIPMVFDGTIINIKESQYVFDIDIDQIESVEQLTPIESLKYTASALFGVVVVTTRKLGPPAPKDAKGTRCWPDGFARLADERPTKLKVPETPGDYRLIVDVVTHDGKVKSLTRSITVTPQ